MLNICFNLDEKYVMPCKVLIREIDATTKEKITYHFIGINERDMGTSNKCKFYPNPDLSYFMEENLTDYYYFSQAAMYRLLIPFLIEADRALYLDIDTVVLKDIKTLYDKEIDYVGAVIDPFTIYHNKRLGHGAEVYYNSGVILFNSKKIRENMPNYKKRILAAQKIYDLDLKDQDIFNIIFQDHITNIGYEWNIDAHNLKEKTESKEVSELKDKAFENPSLVHCMGKEKWWTIEGLHFGSYWDKFAQELIPTYRKKCIIKDGMYIIRR